MSDIRTKAASDDYRRNWEATFMPHEHVEPDSRVLYRCRSCGAEVWDVETGNRRLCATCGDAMTVARTSSSLPVARCPECNRPWSPEP